MLYLEEAFVAVGIDVIVDRRSSGRNCLVQDLQQPLVQLAQFGSRNGCGSAAWPNPSSRQRFIGIDISHAAQ